MLHLARENRAIGAKPLFDGAPEAHRLRSAKVRLALTADLAGIRQAVAATRHLLEMYRRQLGDDKIRRKLQRLDRRLLAVADQLDHLAQPEK